MADYPQNLDLKRGDVVLCVRARSGDSCFVEGDFYYCHEPGTLDVEGRAIRASNLAKFEVVSRGDCWEDPTRFFGVSADKFTNQELAELGSRVAQELARRLDQ
jgi:hypothetical protein